MEESHNNNSNGALVDGAESLTHSAINTQATTNNQNNSTNQHSNRPLIITLIVIAIAIAGIIISIIIVNLLNNQASETQTSSEPNENCTELEDSVEIGQCIQNTFRKNLDVEQLVSSYGKAISTSIENEDFDSAIEMINDRSMFLLSIGECETAMRLLSNMCTDSFDDALLFVVYSDAISISKSCSDESSAQKYSTLRKQLNFEKEEIK